MEDAINELKAKLDKYPGATLTSKQVCEVFEITHRTLNNWKIKNFQIKKEKMYLKENILEWYRKRIE